MCVCVRILFVGLYLDQELRVLLEKKRISETEWSPLFVVAEEQLLTNCTFRSHSSLHSQ